ncbi:uncharacterized protein LOC128553346 [Mercenaria mercenaria]|uniref:uncharacterized protein LOC128553346 n=1 Tax=Mercenaria mercenaria TaxID=6596 RepID=UPI00234E5B05|nr:uncharacterized protein LOC128553346 [Mercenaria mercenaria]
MQQMQLENLDARPCPNRAQTCPLGYLNCNFLNPVEMLACPNNICGALYDDIIGLYKATPLTPFWENTNVQTWCTDPWSVAKCFISNSGYATKTKAAEFDIKELFLLMKNNKELLRNLKGDIHSPRTLSQGCHHRDSLYYSKEMELDSRTDSLYRRAFVYSIKHLRIDRCPVSELVENDYIITSKDEALVHADVIAALSEEAKCLEQKITSCQETNLSAKGIRDEEVHVTKRRVDSISKESLPAVLLPPESKVERLEPGISGQEVPAKERRLESITYRRTSSADILDIDAIHTEFEERQEATKHYLFMDYRQLEEIKPLISVHRDKMAYIDSKIDVQKRLVKLYHDQVVKVPALPIQPEQNQKNVDDVYVDPRMTVLDEDDPNRRVSEMREKEISSFFDVFKERGNPIKNVYVFGEAGIGKSIFCKSMVQKWCKVHMESDMGG